MRCRAPCKLRIERSTRQLMASAGLCLNSCQTVIFGSGNAITKMAYENITPMWCLAIRFGSRARVRDLLRPRIVRQLKGARIGAWMPAALCMALAYLTCNVALDLTTATNVGFLVALPVVFAPLLSCLVNAVVIRWPSCRSRRRSWSGSTSCAATGSSFHSAGRDPHAAVLRGVVARSCSADGRTTGRHHGETQIVASFVVALACAGFRATRERGGRAARSLGTIAFLALLSTCLTFMLQNVALTELPSSTVSLLLTRRAGVHCGVRSCCWAKRTLRLVWLAPWFIVASVIAATWVEVAKARCGFARAPQARACARVGGRGGSKARSSALNRPWREWSCPTLRLPSADLSLPSARPKASFLHAVPLFASERRADGLRSPLHSAVCERNSRNVPFVSVTSNRLLVARPSSRDPSL